MRGIIVVLFSFLVLNVTFGQAQKTFVKSFKLNGNNFIVLTLEGDVEVKEWKDSFLRIHTSVTLENASSEALKSFLMQGRYNLRPALKDGALAISSVPRAANVKYRGQSLDEKVIYTVFVPENVEIEVVDNGTSTSVIYQGDTAIANK